MSEILRQIRLFFGDKIEVKSTTLDKYGIRMKPSNNVGYLLHLSKKPHWTCLYLAVFSTLQVAVPDTSGICGESVNNVRYLRYIREMQQAMDWFRIPKNKVI